MEAIEIVGNQVAALERKLSPETLSLAAKIISELPSVQADADNQVWSIVRGHRKSTVKVPILDESQTKIIGYETDECESEIETTLAEALKYRNNGKGYSYAKNRSQGNGLPRRISLPDSAIKPISNHPPGSKERIAAMAELYRDMPESASISAFSVTDENIADYMVMIFMERDKVVKPLFQRQERVSDE